jgi:transcriptional regulator with PAS, ATPase and Fis domain
MQASLLRVLESGEYRPLGSSKPALSDFRLVSAALPRFQGLVKSGTFREDLYYRISALWILVPPLRERGDDAVELAALFASRVGLRLTTSAISAVRSYAWPGNVRQLRQCLDVASISSRDGLIGGAALAEAIGAYTHKLASASQVKSCSSPAEAALARALEELDALPDFGARDFARAAAVSRRSAQRFLAELLRARRVARSGAGRATRYRLLARQSGPS